jgi:DNA/RNA endonuclease YhcR with UshA esterase domain
MGTVSSVYDSNKTKTIMIEEPSIIKVMVFKNKGFKEFDLAIGDKVEVIGRVEDYNGQKEILGQRIRKIG